MKIKIIGLSDYGLPVLFNWFYPNKVKSYFFTAIIFSVSIYFSPAKAQQQTAVMKIVNGSPKILPTQSILKSAFESEYNDGTIISSISIEYQHAPYYYLVGKGSNNNEPRIMAIQLEYKAGDDSWVLGIAVTEVKHACAGHNCISCSFHFAQTGAIVGCDCSAAGSSIEQGYCNHSVWQSTIKPGHLGNFY